MKRAVMVQLLYHPYLGDNGYYYQWAREHTGKHICIRSHSPLDSELLVVRPSHERHIYEAIPESELSAAIS